MSRETGYGGMGMHKHAVSGRVPKNKAVTIARARDVNRESEERARRKLAKRPKMFGSMRDLLKG